MEELRVCQMANTSSSSLTHMHTLHNRTTWHSPNPNQWQYLLLLFVFAFFFATLRVALSFFSPPSCRYFLVFCRRRILFICWYLHWPILKVWLSPTSKYTPNSTIFISWLLQIGSTLKILVSRCYVMGPSITQLRSIIIAIITSLNCFSCYQIDVNSCSGFCICIS